MMVVGQRPIISNRKRLPDMACVVHPLKDIQFPSHRGTIEMENLQTNISAASATHARSKFKMSLNSEKARDCAYKDK